MDLDNGLDNLNNSNNNAGSKLGNGNYIFDNLNLLESNYIDNILDIKAPFSAKSYLLYDVLTDIERALSVRIVYEILNNASEKFEIKEGKRGSIRFNVKEISKTIKIPKKLLEKGRFSQDDNIGILSPDEYNQFKNNKFWDKNKEDYDLIKRVLYCTNENGKIIGNKLDLILNNSNYRNDVIKYCELMISVLSKAIIYKKNNYIPYINDYYNRSTELYQQNLGSREEFLYEMNQLNLNDMIKLEYMLLNKYMIEMKQKNSSTQEESL